MTSLHSRTKQGGSVDSRRCGVFDWSLKKYSYLFFMLGSIWSCRLAKIRSNTKFSLQNSTHFYLLYEYLKRFVQLIVQRAVKCIWTLSGFQIISDYNKITSVKVFWKLFDWMMIVAWHVSFRSSDAGSKAFTLQASQEVLVCNVRAGVTGQSGPWLVY